MVLFVNPGFLAFHSILMERAKDGSELFIVSDDHFQINRISGWSPCRFRDSRQRCFISINSGIYRTFLTGLDVDSKNCQKGSPFGDLTQIDQVRDMNTLKRAIDSLEENLRNQEYRARRSG